jgi:hypothetical protein
MTLKPKAIRIEPAFDDREQIRSMFERNAPYRALASYAPEGIKDETREGAKPVLPWFRGDWALGGKPLVENGNLVLYTKRFWMLQGPSSARHLCILNSLPSTSMDLCPLARPTSTTHPSTEQHASTIRCRF